MKLPDELFGDSPARDDRFAVKDVWSEMDNFPPDHPKARAEFLHRQMNEEINGLEISARNIVDYPDAPWELRMAMARQCSDESRHIEMFRRSYEERGGVVGEYPVLNFQYRILTRIDTLIGRLTVQNRSFEAAGIDAIQKEIQDCRASGEDDLVMLFDAQIADEIEHVRYANTWIKTLMNERGARAVLDLSRAVSNANEALRLVAGDAIAFFPVADDVRREAGFTEAEIDVARAQPGS
jgi:uncharacterized ferritin-like protein (DUF455 family)